MTDKKKSTVPKVPKGKRATVAYEAKDNSLHRTELDRDIHDAKIDYRTALVNAGDYMAEQAPYVDDWQCKAVSGSEEFQTALEDLMSGFAYAELVRAQARLCELEQQAAAKK